MSKDKKPNEKGCSESFVVNPIMGIALVGMTFVAGPGWIPCAVASLALSNIVGYYTEEKINELDAVTRKRLKEKTGVDQPGDASQVGELVRKTNQTIGVFIPTVPLVSLCAGVYMGYKAKKLAKEGECTDPVQQEQNMLGPGFVAEGRCCF